jgi:hypothetical protein
LSGGRNVPWFQPPRLLTVAPEGERRASRLTVSSQMPNPVTTGGRIVDIFLEVWAITVVATVAASFTAFLQKK